MNARTKKQVYVHFGNATRLPMLTVRFSSHAAAKRAVAESLANGWPARVQVVEGRS